MVQLIIDWEKNISYKTLISTTKTMTLKPPHLFQFYYLKEDNRSKPTISSRISFFLLLLFFFFFSSFLWRVLVFFIFPNKTKTTDGISWRCNQSGPKVGQITIAFFHFVCKELKILEKYQKLFRSISHWSDQNERNTIMTNCLWNNMKRIWVRWFGRHFNNKKILFKQPQHQKLTTFC